MNERIILLGSTGYTAQLLLPLLKGKYEEVSTYNRSENGSLEEFLKGDLFKSSDVVINCIGPFNLTGLSIVEKVIENGQKYIDITGELHFVRNSFETLSEKAISHCATIVHSCAFESFFADHLVNKLATSEEKINSLRTFYKFDQTRPSAGTRSSAKIHSYFSRDEVINHNWVNYDENKKSEEVSFMPEKYAYFAPYPEILFFKNRFNVADVSSFYLVDFTEAQMLKGMSIKEKPPIEKVISKLSRSKYKGPDLNERVDQNFELFVAKEKNGLEKVIKLSGKDMYLRTAEAVFKTLKFLIETSKKGIFSPYELIGSMSVFEEICHEANLKVESIE